MEVIGIPIKIKDLIAQHPDLKPHLFDVEGIWGELPLTENNLNGWVDGYKIVRNNLNIYVG